MKSLFITRFSLSPRTAIGVQTMYLLEQQQSWTHFHWSQTELRTVDANSKLLENRIVARFGARKPVVLLEKTLATLRLGWWSQGRLTARGARYVDRWGSDTSVAYLAPIDSDDARRMRAIVERLEVPFILHLWDFLDSVEDSETYGWLISHAAKVLCLSSAMFEVVSRFNRQAELLRFYRPTSRYKATSPAGGPLTIALIGNIGSYLGGLDCLSEAVGRLKDEGAQVSLVYVGTERALERFRRGLSKQIPATGFIKTDDGRDEVLSKANVAFLPGPTEAPHQSARSRYSIPSRVLDYMAVSLPVIGFVHRQSATGEFLREMGLERTACCSTVDEMVSVLKMLLDEQQWRSHSERSAAAFGRFSGENGAPTELRKYLDAATLSHLQVRTEKTKKAVDRG